MSQNKDDRRYRRSERLLRQAMSALIDEKGFETLTVREITERADVAYATFFRHYANKEDALIALIADDVKALEALARINAAASGDSYFEVEGELAFRYVQTHATMFRAIFNSPRVRMHLSERLAAHISQFDGLRSRRSSIPTDVLANHAITALLGMMDWWLRNDMPYPPATMGTYYALLIAPVD